MRMGKNAGHILSEKILQVSKDEQEYFKNKKVFTKPNPED